MGVRKSSKERLFFNSITEFESTYFSQKIRPCPVKGFTLFKHGSSEYQAISKANKKDAG